MVTRSSSITVRKARPSDAPALTAVYRESWSAAYLGIIPAMVLRRAVRRRDEAWWQRTIKTESHLLVLDVDGAVVGYATCGVARSSPRQTGEIYELYVTPLYQGLGLGEYLFEACRGILDRMGLRYMIVWALTENAQAAEFYKRRGGQPLARTRERMGGATLEKVAFVW